MEHIQNARELVRSGKLPEFSEYIKVHKKSISKYIERDIFYRDYSVSGPLLGVCITSGGRWVDVLLDEFPDSLELEYKPSIYVHPITKAIDHRHTESCFAIAKRIKPSFSNWSAILYYNYEFGSERRILQEKMIAIAPAWNKVNGKINDHALGYGNNPSSVRQIMRRKYGYDVNDAAYLFSLVLLLSQKFYEICK